MTDPKGDAPSRRKGNPPVRKLVFRPKPSIELSPKLRSLVRKLQKNYPLFSNMSKEEVLLFLRLCKSKSFKKGQAIFDEADTGDTFFIVIGGEVILRLENMEVTRLGPGKVFGKTAMLDISPCYAAAVAGEKTLLFIFERKTLTSKLPSLVSLIDLCPFGIRSEGSGLLCFDPRTKRVFEPPANVIREFCKGGFDYKTCRYYLAFKESAT